MSDKSQPPVPRLIIKDRWKLVKRLGAGSFGEIYLAIDQRSGDEVAVKLEKVLSTKREHLKYESALYKYLKSSGSFPGIPKMKAFSREGPYNCMVMQLLGYSLEDLFNKCNRVFSLKTVLMIADQVITRLEFVHSRGLIHRDVKPNNFMIGTDSDAGTVYVIDFGLSKQFVDRKTRLHIPYREGKSLTGTARYASITNHQGVEQSRRDDLEAMGYVFMYFLRGKLPWQGTKAKNRKLKYQLILQKKVQTSLEELCDGYPIEFHRYLTYCRSLGFDDTPDYKYLRRLLSDLYTRQGYTYDGVFDWTGLNIPDSHGR